jgi:hypothetical protein
MSTLPQRTGFEYRSKEVINGLPLIHINLGIRPKAGEPLIAKGVVAIGNIAYGVVSIGAVAFGVVTLAAFGLGLVSLAGIAIGIIALGAVSLGYEYAFGAVVQSSGFAIGAISLDFHLVVWLVIVVASVAAGIWRLRKAKTG